MHQISRSLSSSRVSPSPAYSSRSLPRDLRQRSTSSGGPPSRDLALSQPRLSLSRWPSLSRLRLLCSPSPPSREGPATALPAALSLSVAVASSGQESSSSSSSSSSLSLGFVVDLVGDFVYLWEKRVADKLSQTGPNAAAPLKAPEMEGYYCFLWFLAAFLPLYFHGAAGQSLNQTCDPADLQALLDFSSGLDSKAGGLVGFDGLHPAFPGATNLTVLDISSNSFSGVINSSALCLAPVEVLRFSGNGFSGEVPGGLNRCKALAELSLDGNDLTGNIPRDLYTLPKLRRLSLQENQLSGNLGNDLGNLSQLVQLDLSDNSFSGFIPDVFGGLRWLTSLNLASNMFHGELPASLSTCRMLRAIIVRNNSLSGEIAIDFESLQNLQTFDAGSNILDGTIPSGVARCAELRTLNLARNNLVGEIPESFKEMRSLSYLSLTGNSFTNLSSALQVLQHLPSLTSLVLTRNFRGSETMPVDGINGFKSMRVLVLANCLLTGIIPHWIKGLQSLSILDISWNKLNGNIPPWLGKLDNLFYIDLSNNSFSGELPKSFAHIRSLVSSGGSSEQASTEHYPLFVISDNSTGRALQYNQASSFPPSLVLSNNFLIGPVLPDVGCLAKLHVLDLSWNNFSGPIPDELSNMSSLEMLNLAHNNLNGSIPSSLTKLNFLSKFDVSYNNLTGDIPTGGQFSTFTDEYFEGNSALCLPRNSSCLEKASFVEEIHDTDTAMDITYTIIVEEVGFVFGLMTVPTALLFGKAWRAAYFLMIDAFFNTLYVLTMVNVNRLRRKWENEIHP
ncbi:hypothetical protein HU200_006741 [Digitaria exilis]|uniref:Uncharacterized protein n=1 Tax=Digitaria exilis TaxID=1010633 RepID=A0A835KT37_9POAL|nr:hypothetical protein HU200_006741 [Digitaria exilis]